MIRLNVSILIEKSENRKPVVLAATELVAKSLHDKGCISYDFFASMTSDDRYMICETWDSKENLDAHIASDHFRTLVPKLQELSTMTLEEFNF